MSDVQNSKNVTNPYEKPTPAFLEKDYPYQGEKLIIDIDSIEATGVLYEIRCKKCGMSIRSQGKRLKATYERLVNGNGCIGCGSKELVVRQIDMDGKS